MSDWKQKYDRDYSDAERTLFAEHVARRERLRPRACNHGAECWVSCGPPCYRAHNGSGRCTGCGGKIVGSVRARP